jgi:hypothetical protein
MTEDNWVEIYRLTDSAHASIIQNALEDEGIPCQLEGEHQGGLTGVLEVRLLVQPQDEERAAALIRDHEVSPDDASDDDEDDDEDDDA